MKTKKSINEKDDFAPPILVNHVRGEAEDFVREHGPFIIDQALKQDLPHPFNLYQYLLTIGFVCGYMHVKGYGVVENIRPLESEIN